MEICGGNTSGELFGIREEYYSIPMVYDGGGEIEICHSTDYGATWDCVFHSSRDTRFEEGGISIKPEGMEIEVYPNPFNAILNIQIATVKTLHATSPQKALATVGVYDINGRLVFSPFNPMNRVVSPREQGQQPFPSRYGGMGESGSDEYRSQKGEFIWNPQNLPSGIYLIRVSDGEKAETKKVLYLK